MLLDQFLDRVHGVRGGALASYMARCPAHDDQVMSLGIKGVEDRILLKCHAGCDTGDILSAMGLSWGDLFYDSTASPENGSYERTEASTPEEQYIYTDESGVELYRVVRYAGKRFRQVRKYVPYRLNALQWGLVYGATIYIVEGEKDVHALEDAGCIATCNAGGAGEWKPEFSKYFRGAKVVIVADKDEPGMKHAKEIAAMLYPVAAKISIVEAREGKDAADHLYGDRTPEEFVLVQEVK